MASSRHARFRTDLEKHVIVVNLENRGYTRVSKDNEDEWNFYWASVSTIRQMFSPDSGIRLTENQFVNHFPNFYELCRKDLMVKNFKRYRKDLERDGNELAERDEHGKYRLLDIVPQTYLLPGDYNIFLDEFKRNPSVWILKPNARSQGSGIVIVNKLAQIKKWAAKVMANCSGGGRDSYLASRYVENPLLIGGKKFDLRLYVLVTSYRPLKVYFCRNGFARFCNVKYSADLSDLDNPYVHLTNVAIQKKGSDYNDKHGNKFHIRNLRLHLEATRGHAATSRLFDDIENIILQSLKAVQNVMINDRHCFECYGFDILIDADLKPWLLEVNASPSLSTTTDSDRILKTQLLDDIFSVVFPPDFPSAETSQGCTSWNPAPEVGQFVLIYDEAAEMQKEEAVEAQAEAQKAGGIKGGARRMGSWR